MTLTPPGFWSREAHPAAWLLAPLGVAYAAIVEKRLAVATPYRVAVPVICAGNVTMGGVGKTPWTILLAEFLTDRGRCPHVLTRGYGGRAKGPLRVAGHDARQVGDEALLLAGSAPCWVGSDRVASATLAVEAGADVLLMDDGFQNPGLYKDLSFLLVDAETGFGNARVFPAGPLRERPEAALRRAQAIVSVGRPGHTPSSAIERLAGDAPVLTAWLETDISVIDAALPVHAFAGIGRPERFFDALRRAGLDVRATRAFPDHHRYTVAELRRLVEDARAGRAQLVTTEKDDVRLPEAFRTQVTAVPARMRTDLPTLAHVLGPLMEDR